MPDAFIKYNNTFIIVEHKKMKSTGGGQDKQITEIIDFIKFGERGVHYVFYLDGILFNKLINPPRRQKIYRSKLDILSYLENNPYNYFVNEYGFNKLIDNIKKLFDDSFFNGNMVFDSMDNSNYYMNNYMVLVHNYLDRNMERLILLLNLLK